MRITETFSPDCRSSTIVLDNKPHCNGSSTLTAFDPATGVANYLNNMQDHVKGHSIQAHLTWDFRGGARDTISRHGADHTELVR